MDHSAYFEKLQGKTEEWREIALRPLLKLLVAVGVTANGISTFRIILAIIFPWLILSQPRTAWTCLIVSIVLDGLDGALARYAKTASDRGKFIDVLADQITFSLLATGLIRVWPQHSLVLALLAFLIPAAYLIVAVAKNEGRVSDWLIKPRAQLTAYKIIFLLIAYGAWQSIWAEPTTIVLFWSLIFICAAHFLWRYLRFINKS